MNIADFKQLLTSQPNANLQFVLPDHQSVPAHFHVTEVGRIDKAFIDCGGTPRTTASCQLQLWTADDINHRLTTGKLAKIIDLAQSILKDDDLPVEVEYGQQYSSIYSVSQCNLFLELYASNWQANKPIASPKKSAVPFKHSEQIDRGF